MTPHTLETLNQQFSPVHMEPYTWAANGDSDVAVAIYEWNIQIAGAFLEDLAIVEVLLRNALDRRLRENIQSQANVEPWYHQDNILFEKHWPIVDDTIKQLAPEKGDKEPNQDELVAALPFGLWTILLGPSYQSRLWPILKGAFPFASPIGKPDRDSIYEMAENLRDLRNEIAHHRQIFDWDLDQCFRNIKTLTASVSPPIQGWLVKRTRVPLVLRLDPLGRVWKSISN